MVQYPTVIALPNSSPAKTVQEFIAYAKSTPGRTFATPGHGTGPHLAGELFKRAAGIELTHVPYRGAAPAINDLIPGRVDSFFNNIAPVVPLMQQGQVRGLAVTTARSARPPRPTCRPSPKSGLPGFDVPGWYAIFVPAKSPPEIVAKMNADINTALADPARQGQARRARPVRRRLDAGSARQLRQEPRPRSGGRSSRPPGITHQGITHVRSAMRRARVGYALPSVLAPAQGVLTTLLTARERNVERRCRHRAGEDCARPARDEHIPLAIFYMVVSGVVFTASSAASKWLIAIYPIGEVLFARTCVALITIASFVLPTAGFAVYRTRRLGAHAMRACSQAASQSMLLVAFSLMPLAGATAIMFSSPIFATLASAYFLHEKVGPTRWTVLLVGFLGVLVIASPGADSFQIGALFALGNAVLFGTVVAGVRGMTATEFDRDADHVSAHACSPPPMALTLPFGFVMPTGFDA